MKTIEGEGCLRTAKAVDAQGEISNMYSYFLIRHRILHPHSFRFSRTSMLVQKVSRSYLCGRNTFHQQERVCLRNNPYCFPVCFSISSSLLMESDAAELFSVHSSNQRQLHPC